MIFFFLLICAPAFSQTLIINEVSNGSAGNQEYVELVVVDNTVPYNCGTTAPPCIDIRGWIFDDNSGYHGTSGIASGAVRFSFDPLWSCVPLGTIILIYNNSDPNTSLPANDLSMTDGNCRIVAPINSPGLFESNSTTPGAVACSYPASGWTAGGTWNNTLLANTGDCARIVNLAGCEVFSVCWGSDNANPFIYFSGSGTDRVWYFNSGDPTLQANWTLGCADPSTCGSNNQTPGSPNNASNAAYIAQFNNGCAPITPINVTAGFTNAGCTCDGTATANPSGSIPGYTYSWYDAAFTPIGQTTVTATGLCAGTYYVIATSSIGCSDTASVTINSTISSAVTVSNNGPLCTGQTLNLTTTLTPADPAATYSWTGPGGFSSSMADPTLTNVNATNDGVYTVTVTLGGCSTSVSTTVTVNPLPLIAIPPATICNGSGTTLSASGAVSYSWSPATGLSSTTGPSVTASPTATTVYTVTGISAEGCTGSNNVTVTVNPVPVVNANGGVICEGNTFTINATGATTYTWSPAAGLSATTGPSVNAGPSSTTTYTVTGTSSGCSASDTAVITVNPNPVLSVPSIGICPGTSGTLTASGADTYTWSPATGLSATTGSGVTANPTVTTSYLVTGTSAAGCSSAITTTVVVNPTPTVVVPADSVCAGSGVTLNASGAATYTWSPATGLSATTGESVVASPSVSTNYTVTGTSAAGCSATTTAVVTVNPVPNVIASPQTICSGQNDNIALSSSVTGTGFSWIVSVTNVSGSTSGSGNNISEVLNVISPPSGTVDYAITPVANGCTGPIVVITVTVEAVSINSIAVSNISCNGMNDGTIDINATGASQYSTDGGITFQSSTHFVTGPGTYTVVAQNALGCNASSVVTITEPAFLATSVSGADETCVGSCNGTATAAVSGGTAPYTYSWSNGANVSSINSLCAGNYTVTVTDSNGCTVSGSVMINSLSGINIDSVSLSDVHCNGGNDGSLVIYTTPAAAQYSIDGGVTFQGSGNFSALSQGNYSIVALHTSGCQATTSITVNQPAALVLTVSPDVLVCPGQSASLSANVTGGTAPYHYHWDHGLPDNSAQTVSPAASDVYNVYVTDSFACTSSGQAISITVPAALTVTASADQIICPGNSVSISGNSTGGTGPFVYTWTNNVNANVLNGPDQVVSPSGPTVYTITVQDNCGTTASDSLQVNFYPVPALGYNLDVNNGCSPVTVNFTNTTAIGAGDVLTWQFGDGTGATGTSADHVFTDAGCYSITLQVSTSNGCTDDTTVLNQVCVFPLPVADFTFTPQNADVYNSEVNFVDLSTGVDAVHWDFAGLGTAGTHNPSFIFPTDSGGHYQVCLSVVSPNGCLDSICHEVYIVGDVTVYVPNAFTPDGDGINDFFYPVCGDIDRDDFRVLVFDRWGLVIFETHDLTGKWDGTQNGIRCKEDTYVWKVKFRQKSGVTKEVMGHVSLLK